MYILIFPNLWYCARWAQSNFVQFERAGSTNSSASIPSCLNDNHNNHDDNNSKRSDGSFSRILVCVLCRVIIAIAGLCAVNRGEKPKWSSHIYTFMRIIYIMYIYVCMGDRLFALTDVVHHRANESQSENPSCFMMRNDDLWVCVCVLQIDF